MSSAAYIFLGLLITFLAYFLVTWGLASLYFWVSKEEIAFAKDVRIALSLSAIGFLSGILMMIALSSVHIYVFATLTALFSFGIYLGTLKYLWKFNNFDAITLATTLAIILNPAWLRLLGII